MEVGVISLHYIRTGYDGPNMRYLTNGMTNVCINVKVGGGKAITVNQNFKWNPEVCIAKTTLTEICVIRRRLKCVIAIITLTTVYCAFWLNARPCHFALVRKQVGGVTVQ